MIYFLETKLPEIKSIQFAIRQIYGIGKFQSALICKKLGFSLNLKLLNLSQEQLLKILKLIEISKLIITNDLRKLQTIGLKRLINIKCYRGLRKIKGLPTRGQRTHTNAKSQKRNRNIKNVFIV